MAQSIILKRSAQEGKTPDTGSLNLGELAINTYDGKVFLKKSGSVESIQTLVTTDSVTTGSVTLTGDLTVQGAVNARQFNINIISSSVIYQSGSTKFGDTSDDIHSFTGSVNITGSFLLNGSEVGGNLPNTYDFNLEQTAAYDFEIPTEVEGVVSFVAGGNGNVKIKSNPETADITINDVTYFSVSTSSVIVAKSLLPDVSGTIDLGSIDKPFRHLYVGTGSIYLINPQGTLTKEISANTIVTTTDITNGSVSLAPSLPAGIVSSSAQLTSTYDTRYVLSGSITQTTWDNIASKPNGIFSGSSQLPTGIVSGSSQVDVMSTTNIAKLATTGSNTFIGNQTITGSVYITGSSYVNGGNFGVNTISPKAAFQATPTSSGVPSIPSLGTTNGYVSTYFTNSNTNYGLLGGSLNNGNYWLQVQRTDTTATAYDLALQPNGGNITIGGGMTISGNILPEANGTRDLGSSSYRWSTIYTSDLSLNNGIGDWTIVEGEDDLFLYNNKKGKVYKFALTEVDPKDATPKIS